MYLGQIFLRECGILVRFLGKIGKIVSQILDNYSQTLRISTLLNYVYFQVLFCKLSQDQVDLYKKYINSRDVASILSGGMKVGKMNLD